MYNLPALASSLHQSGCHNEPSNESGPVEMVHYNFVQGSANFLNEGPVYCTSDFRRGRLWPGRAENAPASVRVRNVSGLVASGIKKVT